MMDDDELDKHFVDAAKVKWRYLRGKGYKAFHCQSAGVVFGTSEGGEAGHISWFGKVTWLEKPMR